MASLTVDRRRVLLLVMGVAITVWGTVGFFQRLRIGRGGYTYSPEYIVNYVERGGPAEEAGLQA